MVEDGHRGAVLVVFGIGLGLLGWLTDGRWGAAVFAAGMVFVGAGVVLMAWSAKRN